MNLSEDENKRMLSCHHFGLTTVGQRKSQKNLTEGLTYLVSYVEANMGDAEQK
jgi:hypothetical protein